MPPDSTTSAHIALLEEQAQALHRLFLAAVDQYAAHAADDKATLRHASMALRAQSHCRQTLNAVYAMRHPRAASVKARTATAAMPAPRHYPRPDRLADKISQEDWQQLQQSAPHPPRDPKLTTAYLLKRQYELQLEEAGALRDDDAYLAEWGGGSLPACTPSPADPLPAPHGEYG